MGKAKPKPPPLRLFTFRVRKLRKRFQRQYLVSVKALRYTLALSKVLALHPNKYINITHARRMTIIEAKAEAARLSKKDARTKYVIVDNNGDCDIGNAPLRGSLYAFKNGKEVDDFVSTTETNAVMMKISKKSIPAQSQKAKQLIKQAEKSRAAEKTDETNNTKVMATKTKSGKKEKAAPAKKVATSSKDWGKKVSLSNKEMTKRIQKGFIYRDPNGVNKTKYIPERPNQDAIMKDYYEQAPAKK